jgi:cell division protease FtsH
MPRPDTEGRYEILRLQLASKNVSPDVDLLQLARDLPGLVGADLANIVNEAQLNGKGHPALREWSARFWGGGEQTLYSSCWQPVAQPVCWLTLAQWVKAVDLAE